MANLKNHPFMNRRGQRFGKLVVLQRVKSKRVGRSRRFCTRYLVQCDCGTRKIVRASSMLVRRTNISCGCSNARKKHLANGYGTKEYEIWCGAKERARESNLPFSLLPSDIVIPQRCPLLNVILRCGTGRFLKNSPSLDRIIPDLGYTKENTIVISHRANQIKNNATLEELKTLTANLEKIWPVCI